MDSDVPSCLRNGSPLITVVDCRWSPCPTCYIGLARATESRASDSSRASTHDGDVLFEDATTSCLSNDNALHSIRMNSIPVDLNLVRFSRIDGKAYFWHRDYPQSIQFVVNGAWTSKHVLLVKQYAFYCPYRLSQIRLISDRGPMDENMKRIVEEAERLLSRNQSAIETPRPSQHPTFPSVQSYNAKVSWEPPSHKPVGKRTTLQRRLLPASNPGPSASVRKHPYPQAPRGQTQPRQGTTGGPYPRLDYPSM